MKIKFDQQEVGKVESGGSRVFTRHTAQSSIQHKVLQLCYIAREKYISKRYHIIQRRDRPRLSAINHSH